MQLRPYQQAAVNAVYEHLRSRPPGDNPCVVIPTAGGKTPVLATICRDAVELWNGRVLLLAHVKELLEQAAEKLQMIAPGLPVGVYSSGLGRKDLGYAITVAGIQSVYKHAVKVGHVDLVIVDECHLLAPDGEGMHRTLISDLKAINPNVRIIGLTATPYRMKHGPICAEGNILNNVCYEVGVKELIAQGYLCPLRTKSGRHKPDPSQLHVRAGEFVASEVEELMDADNAVGSACREIVEQTVSRRSVLIFASGLKHAEHVCNVMQSRHGIECGMVTGESLPFERATILERFRRGDLKYLCNVNVLTTGFDAPNIDCVALLRPTLSPGLYYQMVGRGFRIDPGKTDCLILDFGGNVVRHGPVDAISVDAPRERGNGQPMAKECPECQALIAMSFMVCPECGHAFPPPNKNTHEGAATSTGIISGQVTRTTEPVLSVGYYVHHKRNDPDGTAPPTMKVEYQTGFSTWAREWVCFEHVGYARNKAEAWWRARSNDAIPSTVAEAVDLAIAGCLAEPTEITIENTTGDPFDRVVDSVLGDQPPRLESCDDAAEPASAGIAYADDDIPF